MNDNEIILEISSEIGKIVQNFGLPNILGEVWATLYFKGDMTQEQLVKELNCGLSSISQSLNILEKLGSVYTVSKQGRKQVYSAQSSITQTVHKRMGNINRIAIIPMIELLSEKEKQIQNKETKLRITQLKKKYQKFEKMLNLISAFHSEE